MDVFPPCHRFAISGRQLSLTWATQPERYPHFLLPNSVRVGFHLVNVRLLVSSSSRANLMKGLEGY